MQKVCKGFNHPVNDECKEYGCGNLVEEAEGPHNEEYGQYDKTNIECGFPISFVKCNHRPPRSKFSVKVNY